MLLVCFYAPNVVVGGMGGGGGRGVGGCRKRPRHEIFLYVHCSTSSLFFPHQKSLRTEICCIPDLFIKCFCYMLIKGTFILRQNKSL